MQKKSSENIHLWYNSSFCDLSCQFSLYFTQKAEMRYISIDDSDQIVQDRPLLFFAFFLVLT